MKKLIRIVFFISLIGLITACSATKFVPEGSYLLDEVKITTDNEDVRPSSLRSYLRQTPNTKWFSLFKTQLYVYDLAGRDSANWMNKFLKKIGDAPIIYSEAEADRSQQELTKAVQNRGYMGAKVDKETSFKKKKLKLHYHVITGRPYLLGKVSYDINDNTIEEYLHNDSANTVLVSGDKFDVGRLDAERQRIVSLLLNNGYYKFNKDYISYTADTIRNTYLVDLTLHVKPYQLTVKDTLRLHKQYRINNISFITEYDVLQPTPQSAVNINDSIHYNGYNIYYKDRLYFRPKVLADNIQFTPGSLYSEKDVQRTYSYFARLQALKYTNIRFTELSSDSALLNCYVLLTKSKQRSVSFEVEGTNSAGDLGAAASLSFQHKNLFHGSETFMLKLRGAYESITGLQDYTTNSFKEYGVETSINFPNFIFPFLSSDFKRRMRATTEFGIQYNYQLRPEFSRTVASGSWSYKWTHKTHSQHRIDLIDVGYLYLPWISDKFKEQYTSKGQDYIFEYNYKNRMIVHSGYIYNYNSLTNPNMSNGLNNSYSIRISAEIGGNLLYLFSKAFRVKKNSDGEYTLLNIPYLQYAKGDFDFVKNFRIDYRNAVAFHIGAGIAIPYGNSRTVSFEKQYFGGGANSVRGWSVRSLGPGAFSGDGNLLNQTGDIKLIGNLEYRSKLFWKLQGALFVDAGNIWTIRNYANQPGGVFKFDTFFKQIAMAYGLGIRLDLDYFILRFDGGMKALNPAYENGNGRWPLLHPKFSRDFAFHFAVGYPF